MRSRETVQTTTKPSWGFLRPWKAVRKSSWYDSARELLRYQRFEALSNYATRNLYFFTLYRGTNGSRMGTLSQYFRYSGSSP